MFTQLVIVPARAGGLVACTEGLAKTLRGCQNVVGFPARAAPRSALYAYAILL